MRLPLLLVCLLPAAVGAADRVKQARENKIETLKALFKDKQLPFPPEELYLRAFKHEKVVEVWSGPKGKPLTLVRSFPICAASGELGPKRKEGDLQVPEGFYEIKSFNPTSNFHLSLEVNYPNRSDRVLSDKEHPGGEIYLHGNCASIGCIAIQDDPIEEVYLLAYDAKVRPVRLDIFPRRLDADGVKAAEGDPNLDFWKQLAPGYAAFEQNHRPPTFKIDGKTGAYIVTPGR
jgi:murein L,D-transpeptidase YafK